MNVLAETVLLHASGRTPRALADPVVTRILLEPGHEHWTSADQLIRHRAQIGHSWHPALRAWLLQSGWAVRAGDELRCSPPPRSAEDPRVRVVRTVLGEAVAAAVLRGAAPGRHRFGKAEIRTAPGRLRLSTMPRTVTMTQSVRDAETAGGLVCAETAWLHAARELHRTVLVRSGENPAAATVRLPGGHDTSTGAFDALCVVERLHHDHPAAVDPEVLDVAEMAASSGQGRAGLNAAQDEAVGKLLATEIGAVLASPPGAGKTVMCAVMIAEKNPSNVLVAAPKAVLSQWVEELGRFAPGVSVRIAEHKDAITPALGTHTVVMCTHKNAALWAERARREVEIVVVDEAGVLLRRSDQARGLWKLRRLARQGFALTGTPEEHGGGGGTAELVAWARGRDRGTVPELAAELYEPVLMGRAAPEELPTVVTRTYPATPDEAEKAALEAIHARTAPLGGLAAVRARRERREILARPCGSGTASGKHRAASERIVENTAASGQSIVCTSSMDAATLMARTLQNIGVRAAVLDVANRQRRIGILASFAGGDLDVVILTPGAQRGVNLQSANLVVHLDLPESVEQFTQRNGRAARLGSKHPHVEAWVAYYAGTCDEEHTLAFLSEVQTS